MYVYVMHSSGRRRNTTYKNHILVSHSADLNGLFCPYCPLGFVVQDIWELYNHLRLSHVLLSDKVSADKQSTLLDTPETLYHRDHALPYIAYVMLIWAAPIPADRWHCSVAIANS